MQRIVPILSLNSLNGKTLEAFDYSRAIAVWGYLR